MKKPYMVCSNCVMDTSDDVIQFDSSGICDHCRNYYKVTLPNWHTDKRGQEKLERMVASIKRSARNRDFDCILGMSGGADSSYLLYLAKEVLGLRPLVFHVDAGWNTQEASNNIERLVDALKLDLFTEVIDWDEMRDLQLAYFKAGVPHIDHPQDLAFFGTMYRFAHRHGIKAILTGANLSTECVRNPVNWGYYGDVAQMRDIHRRFGTRPLKNFPATHILWHKVYLPYVRGVRVLRPLNYIPYIKKDAISFLTERFGWQPYPQKHFESRFTRFVEGYWVPTKFGFDVRKVQYSSLILTKQMRRDEALEKIAKPALDEHTVAQELEYVARKLDISVEDLKGYHRAENRTFRDYKSQSYLYNIGAALSKILKLEIGGKR